MVFIIIVGICITGSNIKPMLLAVELMPIEYNVDILANSKYNGTMLEALPCMLKKIIYQI